MQWGLIVVLRSIFVRCFLDRFLGLKWFALDSSGGDACESLGGNHYRPSSLGKYLLFSYVFMPKQMSPKAFNLYSM